METQVWIDILGWIGAAALLVAYAMVSARRLTGNSLGYQALNMIGSALLIINSSYYRAFPSVAVNIVWVAIAIFALLHKHFSRRQSNAA